MDVFVRALIKLYVPC